jgi:hypothetical protein
MTQRLNMGADGGEGDFTAKVGGLDRDPLRRIVREAVRIKQVADRRESMYSWRSEMSWVLDGDG